MHRHIADNFPHQLLTAASEGRTRKIEYGVIWNANRFDDAQKAGRTVIGAGLRRISQRGDIRYGGIEAVDIIDAAYVEDSGSLAQ